MAGVDAAGLNGLTLRAVRDRPAPPVVDDLPLDFPFIHSYGVAPLQMPMPCVSRIELVLVGGGA